MSKTNNFVFLGLYIVAWLIFVGLCIEAGGLILIFFFSVYNPEFVQNLYQKLDLSEMYNDSKLAFFGIAVREELTFTHDKEFMGIALVNKKSNCIHAGTASP